MRWRSALALFGLLVGGVGLLINLVIIVPSLTADRSLPGALISFWTYFTHLTNLALLLVYLAALTGWRGLGWFGLPRVMAAMAAYITLVMVYYHFMLAPYYSFEGALLVATMLLHYVAPLSYLLWWAVAAPHGGLRYRHVPWMLVPGLLYVAWALARGAVVGEYPYAILDAGTNGYAAVAAGVATLALAVLLLSGLAVLVDRLLARRAEPA
jgi:hypothetical protein